jgi:hypothetical protein
MMAIINRLTSTVYYKYRPEESWFIPVKFIQAGTTNGFDFSAYDLELSVWNKSTSQFAVIETETNSNTRVICSRKFVGDSPDENGIQLEEDTGGSLYSIYYDVARNLVLPFGVYIANLVCTNPENARQTVLVTFEITITNEVATDLGIETLQLDYIVLPVKNLATETVVVPIRTLPIINLS